MVENSVAISLPQPHKDILQWQSYHSIIRAITKGRNFLHRTYEDAGTFLGFAFTKGMQQGCKNAEMQICMPAM